MLIVLTSLFIVFLIGIIDRAYMDPEFRKEFVGTSAEEKTARLVVQRMRDEFGMQLQSKDAAGKG